MAGLNSGGGGTSASGIRAGRAFVSMGLDSSLLERGLRNVETRFHSFGKTLLKIGGVVGGIGASVLGPLGAIFFETIKHLDDVNDAATRLGTTPEILSNLGHAADMSGSSMEDLESALGKMQKNLASGSDAFKALGLNAKELSGLSLDQQMEAIADALANVENPTERSALAMEIFGKSGRSLLPMLEDGAAGLKAFAEENRALGGEIGGEEAKKGARAMDAYDRVVKVLKNTVRSLGVALLPAVDEIEMLSRWVITAGQSIRKFISDNRQVIQIVAAVAAGLVVAGGAIAALGGFFMLAGAAISGVLAVLAALKVAILVALSPIGLTVIAIAAIAAGLAYLFSLTSAGQGFFGELLGGFGALGEIIQKVMGGVGDALAIGDLKAAGEIAFVGLMLAFAKAIAFMTDRWNKFKSFFVDGWHDAIKLLKLAWNALDEWFSDAFLSLAKLLNDSFGKAIQGMMNDAADALNKADILGLFGDTVKALRDVAGAFGTGQFSTELEKQRKMNKQEHEDKVKAIEDEARLEQEKRDKARADNKADADKDVNTLQRLLDMLTGRAAAMRAAMAGVSFMMGFLFPSDKNRGRLGIGESVKGQFGGASARQAFAFGDKGVQKEQLEVQKDIRAGIKELKASVDDLDGVAFA